MRNMIRNIIIWDSEVVKEKCEHECNPFHNLIHVIGIYNSLNTHLNSINSIVLTVLIKHELPYIVTCQNSVLTSILHQLTDGFEISENKNNHNDKHIIITK